MIQKLESLLKLQEAEIEIQRLNAVLNAVPEKLSELDTKKTALQEAYDNETEAMASLKKKYREMDSEVQTNSERISKSQSKLTAVKTNKEYQALLKEIDDLKGKNSAIEDEMLDCLEQLENSEKELSEKDNILKQMKTQINAEKATIEREADTERQLLETAMEKFGQLKMANLTKSLLNFAKNTRPPQTSFTICGMISHRCHLETLFTKKCVVTIHHN